LSSVISIGAGVEFENLKSNSKPARRI